MTSDKIHVLIAGGGPAGLLSAINLCQRGIRVTVVERAAREKLVVHTNGAGFVMYGCSNYILKRLGIDKTALDVSRESGFMKVLGGDDEELRTLFVDDIMRRETPLGPIQGTTPTARFVLANIFLDELDKYAKEGLADIHFETQVTGYEQISEHKVVLMAKKGEENLKFEGDILFGCDGVHSLIRKQMMREMKTDDYHVDTGLTTYWGKYEESDDGSNIKDLPVTSFSQEEGFTGGYFKVGGPKNPSFSILGCAPGSMGKKRTGIAWAYMIRTADEKKSGFDAFKSSDGREIDLNNRGAKNGDTIKQELLDKVPKNSYLALAVKNTNPERVLKTNLLYHKRMDAPYSFGRVCLLGDAAHPESPIAGQGLNMSLVDAYVLPLYISTALKDGPAAVSAAIKKYAETELRKDVVNAAMSSYKLTDMAMAKNPIAYALVKPVARFLSAKIILGQMLIKNEDLNFRRVYKAEQYAVSKGVDIKEKMEV